MIRKFNIKQWLAVLMVAMTFGTAWAVRGQFGHEQGAAWAAAVGGLALVLGSKRNDWYRRAIQVTLASAIGWGMGGMISYGMVVGYGRSNDFLNAGYGLLMLFVIGGLFGLIGGGLTALTLESSNKKKVKWGQLMAEMVAGGLVAYGFLIMQLELLMTPPRSEAWAFCLGGGLAMIWYMARNRFNASLRVAFITMIGAGFGFAFGNFLQVVGNLLEINFNMWNVMEYSIGFFGGSALAISVYSTKWPEVEENPKPWENRVAYLIAFVLIPFIVYNESLSFNTLAERFTGSGIDSAKALLSSITAGLLICGVIVYCIAKFESSAFRTKEKGLPAVFLVFFAAWIAISFIVTGLFDGKVLSNHILYLVNFLLIAGLYKWAGQPVAEDSKSRIAGNHVILLVATVLIIILLAFVLINTHDELPGARKRFGVEIQVDSPG